MFPLLRRMPMLLSAVIQTQLLMRPPIGPALLLMHFRRQKCRWTSKWWCQTHCSWDGPIRILTPKYNHDPLPVIVNDVDKGPSTFPGLQKLLNQFFVGPLWGWKRRVRWCSRPRLFSCTYPYIHSPNHPSSHSSIQTFVWSKANAFLWSLWPPILKSSQEREGVT